MCCSRRRARRSATWIRKDPRDERLRLDVAFGVNAERWLVATVTDLLTRRELMREEPVVQLM